MACQCYDCLNDWGPSPFKKGPCEGQLKRQKDKDAVIAESELRTADAAEAELEIRLNRLARLVADIDDEMATIHARDPQRAMLGWMKLWDKQKEALKQYQDLKAKKENTL
jgi:hypothetical protein